MADPTPTPPPAPKTPQTHGELDKQLLANIKLGEDVAAAAQDPDHAPRLASEEEIDAATVANLVTLNTDARTLAGQVITARKAHLTVTADTVAAQKVLVKALRDIQQRAKAKFKDKPKRSAYCINKENFGRDRSLLGQDATDIINLGETDALRGLTPAKIAAARAALVTWRQADVAEGKAAEIQSTLLGQLQTKVDAINTARRDIQLAVDTCWPHTDKANAPIRRAFKIPTNKPVAK